MSAQPSSPTFRFPWEAAYLAAILETDESRLQARISVSEEQMLARRYFLTKCKDYDAEKFAIEDALRALAVLKQERLAQA
jgi:hypothetical protein